MQGVLLFLVLVLLFNSAQLSADQIQHAAPITMTLKPRQPHWRPQIMSTYPNGNPESVIFFEPAGQEERIPVKQQRFYEDGKLKNEMDLTVVDENSPGFNEWKSSVVPHGLSISHFSNGKVEKITS